MKVRILLTAVFFSASVMLQAAPFDLADSFDKEGTLFEKLTPANLQNNSILKAGSCFKWLSYKRDAARYQALRRKNITFFSEVVPEAIVRFKDGKLNRVYISVYNKGDSEPITDEKDFELKIEALAKKLSEKTGVRPAGKSEAPRFQGKSEDARLEYAGSQLSVALEFERQRLFPCRIYSRHH